MKKLMQAWELMEKMRGRNALRNTVRGGSINGGYDGETIADDGQVAEGKRAIIERDESVVRAAYALVGLDYDGLIRMDGQTPYSQALEANPKLAQQVLDGESPVLEALKIALAFKPYAEFSQKYGKDPANIRDSIRAEVMAEMKGGVPDAAPKSLGTPVFSSRYAGQRPSAGTSKKSDLASIFGR